LVIEKIQSREVARTYHLIAEDQEWDIRCIKPGADWDDPSNQKSKPTTSTATGTASPKPMKQEIGSAPTSGAKTSVEPYKEQEA
jgi:hypothetical protein